MFAKKLLALLTAALLVLEGMVPVVSAEKNTEGTAADGELYIAESYVNPLYEGLTVDILTFDEAETGFHLSAEETDVVFCDTIEEAAEVLLDGIKDREATIRVNITERLYTELSAVSTAHKEIFYRAYAHDPDDPTGGDYIRFTFGGWSGSYRTSEQGRTLSYYFKYYTTAEEEAAVDARVEELTTAWKAMNMTDYQIIRTIYEYITENVTYDDAGLAVYQNAVSSNTLTMNHCGIFTAYNALIEGTAVCQGYGNLFYRLALEMDIDARIIASIAYENHAWNIVQLEDWYYNIDATWDAKNVETGYQWFLLNEEAFSVKHTRRAEFDTTAFHQAYPMAPVSWGIAGDIDGDGRTDKTDLAFLTGYFSGCPTEIDVSAVDFDGDGRLTRKDVMILARYLAKWDGYEKYFG